MSVNQNWNGAGYILSFPTLYQQEAQHCISYMAKYLAMEYSEDIYSRFSSSAVAIAESMEWDAALCKPISACETLRKDIEQISFSWEILEKASLTSPSSWPLVNFDALTVASIDNPPASHPILSTAAPDAHLHQALASDSSVVTTSSTHLLARELQATILALTGTAPQIPDDASVGTSASTRDLL